MPDVFGERIIQELDLDWNPVIFIFNDPVDFRAVMISPIVDRPLEIPAAEISEERKSDPFLEAAAPFLFVDSGAGECLGSGIPDSDVEKKIFVRLGKSPSGRRWNEGRDSLDNQAIME
jgi:hypothetical protein